ncbi:MAG TPA: permease [Anaerolineaceae bacterium]|nr:permease [Anaerolineaceae bacterium]
MSSIYDHSIKRRRVSSIWLYALAAFFLILGLAWVVATGGWPAAIDRLSTFTTVLLGIFIEAAPFLLLGSLGSGVLEVFFQGEDFSSRVPRHPLLGAMVGAFMGFFFPVCECGVVPLTRRLFQKGLPVPVGIAFLLGAPALNPIVLVSTLVAFGWGPVLWGRIGLTFLIATLTGYIFSFQKDTTSLLNKVTLLQFQAERIHEKAIPPQRTWRQKARQVFTITVDEFFEIGRYLVLGASLAAVLQTIVPQASLLSIGQGQVVSVLVMITLAVLLSVCSTVDAFIALSFAGSFTTGSILAFLVFGPMVDIKSTLMFLHVFQRKTVVYMILVPLFLTVLLTVFLNLNVGF